MVVGLDLVNVSTWVLKCRPYNGEKQKKRGNKKNTQQHHEMKSGKTNCTNTEHEDYSGLA